MSALYDQYLITHIGNVKRGYYWLCEQFPDILEKMGSHSSVIEQHDQSKYGDEEYYAYDAYFYGPNKSYQVKQNFNYAWLHHIHHNPHHWQYWVLQHDDEPEEALEMPYWYVIEMICDWWAFSWASGKLDEIFDWYEKHKDMKLHEKTRKLVEDTLERMKERLREINAGEDWNVIEHHGIKGQEWGVMNGPPYPLDPLYKTPKELSEHMKAFTYKEYDRLMSPNEVEKIRSGSCHDQVMYECQQLRRMGKEPKCLFVIEHENGQGGMTHSLVYYKEGNKYVWFENAWKERAGENEYSSLDDIKKAIKKAHASGEYGDKSKYSDLEFSEFSDSDHEIGEDLQEFVERSLK